jgi:hypothetical protein
MFRLGIQMHEHPSPTLAIGLIVFPQNRSRRACRLIPPLQRVGPAGDYVGEAAGGSTGWVVQFGLRNADGHSFTEFAGFDCFLQDDKSS